MRMIPRSFRTFLTVAIALIAIIAFVDSRSYAKGQDSEQSPSPNNVELVSIHNQLDGLSSSSGAHLAGYQQLAEQVDGDLIVSRNSATGVASFVRVADGASISLVPGGSAEAQADAFLNQHGELFGVTEPENELVLVDSLRDFLGQEHLTFQQVYEDLPVFAAVLKIHFNVEDKITSVNGTFVPVKYLDTNPNISPGYAAEEAVNLVTRQNEDAGPNNDHLTAMGTVLMVYRAGLVQGIPGINHLAYEVEVVNPSITIREFVYIDAHTGELVDQISGLFDIEREISETTLANVVWDEGNGDPNPIPGGWAGGTAQQIIDWQNEVDGAGETYNVFASMTAGVYLSFDGADAKMRTVNNDPNIACPNANWNGTSTNYCSNVTGDDTVAHEWGHAYTEYTNNLIYAWQSGALNESYSDIWGDTVDLLNGRGTDAPDVVRASNTCSSNVAGANFPGNPTVDTVRWLSGEDDPAFFGIPAGSGNAIRDLWDPTCFGDPGKVTDTEYHCSVTDGGGVHTNSGVPNHAFALMVDGGTYNGQTITALGLTKAAHIHWAAQNMLTPASNFADQADALEAACTSLIGVDLPALSTTSTNAGSSGEMITAAECTEVAEVNAAVEFRTEPDQCGFGPLLDQNALPFCGGGPVQAISSEDWESGLGSWTVGTRDVANPATFDTPDWAVVGSLPDSRTGQAAFVADLLVGDCAADTEAGVLYLESPVINIPAGANFPSLAFDHWVATEAGWDGGNVKYSLNGGPWTVLPGSDYIYNAYNSSLNPSDNPMGGEEAFTGSDGGVVTGSWGQSQVDLSGIAGPGDNVQLRYEMGLDGCNGLVGWYVDEVEVYSCQSAPLPPTIDVVPSAVSSTIATNNVFTTTLNIGNNGWETLDWTISEDAGPAPRPADSAPAGSMSSRAGESDPRTPIDYEAAGIFSEGFEDITNLPGWAFQNNSDPTGTIGWFQGNPAVFAAHAGNSDSYAGVNFNSAAGTGTISNWLMTPVFSLENGESLSFWTRTVTGPVFPDRLQVRLSTSGASTDVGSSATDLGDFTTLLLDINPTLTAGGYPDTWTQYTVNITGMSPGAEGRLAFRYFVTNGGPTGTNSDYIGIDSVTSTLSSPYLECESASDIPWMSVSPNAGTTSGINSSPVDVTFDSTGWSTGVYTGTLCVDSNDLVTPRVKVPVTMTVAAASYGVDLAPDVGLSGLVGETITYTVAITNTGNSEDTFDLAVSGNAWSATVPGTIHLNLGETGSVMVAVEVPSGAMEGDMDTVTLMATSQGDAGQMDSTDLTTTTVWYKLYLPIIPKN